jgi:hypothetical protein
MTTHDQLDGGNYARTIWPVFVLSSLRSGSTLLRFLLDSHRRLACPPESKFIAALEPFLEYPQIVRGLQGLGLSENDFLLELRLFVERVMRRYTTKMNKPRWIDKTPSYYRYTSLIERLFQGQVLYIILVRHPLDCICSLESNFEQSTRDNDPDIVRTVLAHGRGRYAWAQYWYDVYARLAVVSASCAERSIVVRYEDLVKDPHTVLCKVCSFIGEEFEPDIVRLAFVLSHSQGLGDGNVRGTETIHQDSIGKWTSWPREVAEAVWDLVRIPATRFGYDLDGS